MSESATPSPSALVGRTISVVWPKDGTFYKGMVIEHYAKKNQHKIMYTADESMETLELGKGPGQRDWMEVEQPSDPLIGGQLVLIDEKPDSEGREWFHVMRCDRENVGDRFTVTVFKHLEEDVEEDEISGPWSRDGDNRFYRVVSVENDYIATVDLNCIRYKLMEDVKVMNEDVEDAVVEVAANSNDGGTEGGDQDEKDEGKDASEVEEDGYVSDKQDGVNEDDSDATMDIDAPVVSKQMAVGGIVSDARAADLEDLDIDIEKVAKVVSMDGGLEISADDGDVVGSLDVEIGANVRGRNEGSVGTQETRDEPLDRGKRRGVFADDGGMHDTASDEEKLGWVAEKRGGGQSQVGDYISLDTGMGGGPRKAFVEAFLPETGTYFVAFCDSRGGNLQIKLTKENHVVLGDEEVDLLTRNENGGERGGGEEAEAEVEVEVEEEVKEVRGVGRAKRRGREGNGSDGKTRKRASRGLEIRGQSARSEICGRCISIVWPGENLVYVALVLGFSSVTKEHQIVYMVDHCIETLDLKYREWTLLPREKEPWISTGMVGKRLFVFWDGEYDDEKSQRIARKAFGESTRVPYEAYVLSYVGDGKYKILYPATEDTEIRELKAEGPQQSRITDKDWDLLDDMVNNVAGLPLIGWTD